ncbi:MAG: tetratricopeptide repeat protein [Alphaproteobacteria bacterium]|nr:tetratricopeptide repeat protein [Alphaproteobacteria bacterium]MCK5659134.1 tetratricopeptide repeat protein [Alphaproteobacteria bacterium]
MTNRFNSKWFQANLKNALKMKILISTLCFLIIMFQCMTVAAEDSIPFREDSGLTKAEYLLSAGQFSAALNTADDVLARHPNNADAYTYRGYAYYRLGETAKASKNFKKALIINPTHLGANAYIAKIYLDKGNMARALEQMQVIRMTCGYMDCEELNMLKRNIDKYKRGDLQEEKSNAKK